MKKTLIVTCSLACLGGIIYILYKDSKKSKSASIAPAPEAVPNTPAASPLPKSLPILATTVVNGNNIASAVAAMIKAAPDVSTPVIKEPKEPDADGYTRDKFGMII